MNTTAAHPAPHRDRVSLWILWFGIFGAPAMWSVQELVAYSLTAHACYPQDAPRTIPSLQGVWGVALLVTVLAILGALAAGYAALHSWRRVRAEVEGGEHHLLEVGEGRTRFMALSGILLSVAFLYAIVMHGIGLLVVPMCG